MPDEFASALVEGPAFSARSVVASLLLGLRRPQMPGRALVRSAGLFGISEGTTRVALSRMVSAGELEVESGVYRLSGSLLDRHGRQETGRHPTLREWDGTWRLAVVGAMAGPRQPAERVQVRRTLEQLRLAEWREGVWVRPDNLEEPSTARQHSALPGCTFLDSARLVEPDDAGALAGRLWPLERWGQMARELDSAMGALSPDDDLGAAFRLASAVVRHLRDDPLLPAQLLPPEWPGPELRATYDRYEAAFSAALRRQLTVL